ncbi:hypothetical protein DPX16_20290 [Anabarilius grahami]|uniref:Uncharacterized protein n=1 Tax=Anabarilius grahami TaxID=495550 RepID=A0A3N0Z9A1_ANAGA|nr:hypothetical protein DPX16_20290 [Anabarilius grahami]
MRQTSLHGGKNAVFKMPSTCCVKSLQQAQVFFTDGWVQDLEIVKVGQKTVVRSKVLDPSICNKDLGMLQRLEVTENFVCVCTNTLA